MHLNAFGKGLGISLENVMSSLLGKQNCQVVVLFLSEDEVEGGSRGHFVTLIKALKQLIQCSPEIKNHPWLIINLSRKLENARKRKRKKEKRKK